MAELRFIFHIALDPAQIYTVRSEDAGVTMIPFGGTVCSELFTGSILPGAVDVQTEGRDHVRHMCAKYMFQGNDSKGNPCRLYVQNEAEIIPGRDGDLFGRPSFITDSPILQEVFEGKRYYSRIRETKAGVDIEIFEISQ